MLKVPPSPSLSAYRMMRTYLNWNVSKVFTRGGSFELTVTIIVRDHMITRRYVRIVTYQDVKLCVLTRQDTDEILVGWLVGES